MALSLGVESLKHGLEVSETDRFCTDSGNVYVNCDSERQKEWNAVVAMHLAELGSIIIVVDLLCFTLLWICSVLTLWVGLLELRLESQSWTELDETGCLERRVDLVPSLLIPTPATSSS
ncbi:hypothetical protein BJ165DRAFT_1400683 [Panaeolus papilionaceus]|nr:hypothetical protein BJ165DRAFT_1400683 [Panaeolus papilionaceus]